MDEVNKLNGLEHSSEVNKDIPKGNESFDIEKDIGSLEPLPDLPSAPKEVAQAASSTPAQDLKSDETKAAPLSPIEKEIKEIEHILAEDLKDVYKEMDPALQKKFKDQGEQTAREVDKLLHKTKIKIRKIVGLIAKWLKVIPGVNKFFIEQQSKIKADEIIKKVREQ